jgi:DNA-binding HxlR family transcriptional regulator
MDKKCTVYRTIDFLSKRWSLLIMLELYKEKGTPKRYSYLKKKLKTITPKILSQRLKELEDERLITKKIDATNIPIKTEYALTVQGKEFMQIVKDIKKWALKHRTINPDCAASNCRNCYL